MNYVVHSYHRKIKHRICGVACTCKPSFLELPQRSISHRFHFYNINSAEIRELTNIARDPLQNRKHYKHRDISARQEKHLDSAKFNSYNKKNQGQVNYPHP